MILYKDVITTLVSEGYLTLQVPEYTISLDKVPNENFIDYPDEWFVRANHTRGPSLNKKENGFIFLSEIGWKANKDDIKKAFESSKNPRGTWEDFEKHVIEHFREIKNLLNKRIIYFEKKLKEAQIVKGKLETGKGNI
ncbi:MAG: hypothetical protein ACFFG0_00560 [Candidatus Thorarchaeota archaeon]